MIKTDHYRHAGHERQDADVHVVDRPRFSYSPGFGDFLAGHVMPRALQDVKAQPLGGTDLGRFKKDYHYDAEPQQIHFPPSGELAQ